MLAGTKLQAGNCQRATLPVSILRSHFASLLLFSQVAPQNLVNVTRGLISVVSRNPIKHFLRFFKNISSVILLKVSHSYIRLMMENSDCDSHEKTGLFCLF